MQLTTRWKTGVYRWWLDDEKVHLNVLKNWNTIEGSCVMAQRLISVRTELHVLMFSHCGTLTKNKVENIVSGLRHLKAVLELGVVRGGASPP